MKHIQFITFLFLLFFCTVAFAQNENSFSAFTGRRFYKPFVSEISSTLNNLSIGKTYSNELVGNDFEKMVLNEVHLGMDMPFLYVKRPNFEWAMSFPVSIHMVWAPFEKTTSPIINNDYRFGLSFTGFTHLDNRYLKNLSFKLTPFAHESTHLGDEITIYGVQNNANFYRVNVSYEYYELGLTLNDPELLDENTLSCRMGFMGLIRPNVGYYTFFANEIGNNVLYPSQRWAEYYLQLNYKKTEGFLTNKQWHPNLSIEFRNRVKYDYLVDAKEDRVWCVNAYIGFDYVPKKANAIKSIGHYIRHYNGINPNGQLRNGMSHFVGYSVVVYW